MMLQFTSRLILDKPLQGFRTWHSPEIQRHFMRFSGARTGVGAKELGKQQCLGFAPARRINALLSQRAIVQAHFRYRRSSALPAQPPVLSERRSGLGRHSLRSGQEHRS